MTNQKKIDCHTHIVNCGIYNEYFDPPEEKGYALVMEFLPYMQKPEMPDKSWELCDGNKQLFLCPSVDIHQDIPCCVVIRKRRGIRGGYFSSFH